MSLNPNGSPAGFYYQAGATAYLIDPAGTYSLAGAAAPTTDPAGTYSGSGASAPTIDPAGTYSGAEARAPTLAAAGTYFSGTGATSAAAETEDPAGAYSPAGASAPTTDLAAPDDGPGASAPTLAAAGVYIPITVAAFAAGAYSLAGGSAATMDPAGTDSSAGANTPMLAAAGASIPITGAASAATEIGDPAGPYSLAGASGPTTGPAGRRSAVGASAPTLAAAPGAYVPVTGATSAAAEIVDPDGAYSLAGASGATTDPVDRHSAGASAPTLAAPGAYIPATGATSSVAKAKSPPGTYLSPGATAPTADPGGTYSAAGASAPTTDPAGTYSSPYALDRLFLEGLGTTPGASVLSFSSATAVTNYYGATSAEASLAKEFFARYADTSATMLFTRYDAGGERPHLLGANISNLTLSQLRSINGSLSITLQGNAYSESINLSGAKSFSAAAAAI